MKQNIFLSILVLFVLVSCKTSKLQLEEKTSDKIYIPKRIESGRAVGVCYSADMSDTVESFIQYEYYTPQFSSNLMDSVFKDSVNLMIFKDVQFQTIGAGNKFETGLLSDYFFQSRLDSFLMAAKEEVDYLESVPWTLELTIDITDQGSYIELNNSGWDYSGGAHGNHWNFYNLFDKKTGHVLQLSDVISDLEVLNRFALPYFKRQHEVPLGMTLEEFGFWFVGDNLEVGENFYFANGEIIFEFNPYAIAPYSAGSLELRIPIADLGDLFLGVY